MVSSKVIFAYIVYALLTALLFLSLLFPEEAVKAYVDERLAAIDPALTIEAATIRPAIPPGLKMVGVDLNRDNTRLAHFENAWMSPDLMSLFRDEKQGRFEARLAEGTINGRAFMTGSGPGARFRAEADLSQIRLEELDAVKHIDRFTLSGLLAGRITHDDTRTPMGATSAMMTVSPLRITLKAPFLGIADIMMNQANADFSISGQSLRLRTLTFEGPMAEGKISGTIDLRRPMDKSRLNLIGNVKPKPELIARLQETVSPELVNPSAMGTRGLTFRVRGTIDNPDVSMR